MTCFCGDPRSLHEHYRRGTDCAAPGCGCSRYRKRRSRPLRDLVITVRLLAGLARDIGRAPRHA